MKNLNTANVGYIGENRYKYDWFRSPLGYIKFLFYVYQDARTGYVLMIEENLYEDWTPDMLEMHAQATVLYVEALA